MSDLTDHTLVWAVHAGVERAARVGRSYLSERFSEGWREVKADHPKVRAALRQLEPEQPAPSPRPARNKPTVRKPTNPASGPSVKETA